MKFKHLLLVVVCIGMTTSAYSQTVKFEYDKSGNRTKRSLLTLTKDAFMVQDEEEHEARKISLEELIDQGKVRLFPNPVQTELTVLLSELPDPGYGNLLLYDMQGRMVIQQEVNTLRIALQLGSLAPGNYLLKLIFGSQHSTWKIIKE